MHCRSKFYFKSRRKTLSYNIIGDFKVIILSPKNMFPFLNIYSFFPDECYINLCYLRFSRIFEKCCVRTKHVFNAGLGGSWGGRCEVGSLFPDLRLTSASPEQIVLLMPGHGMEALREFAVNLKGKPPISRVGGCTRPGLQRQAAPSFQTG